jgi:hypothetical protein
MVTRAIPPAQPDSFALSRNGRQAWWWGIYLFGAIVVPFGLMAWMKGIFFFSFWSVLLLPMGLDYDFSFLCENILDRLGIASADFWAGLFTLAGFPLVYLIFGNHYQLALEAKTLRVFLLLMLSLALLVCASLIGWAKEPSPMHGSG